MPAAVPAKVTTKCATFLRRLHHELTRVGIVASASSDVASSIVVLASATLVLLAIGCTLEIEAILEHAATFEAYSSASAHWIAANWSSSAFVILFALQLTMIGMLALYCDCPHAVVLDIKILFFYTCTIQLMLTTSSMPHLLVFELIGITSFRLIGHYTHRLNATRGSYIAICTNRCGDILFVI